MQTVYFQEDLTNASDLSESAHTNNKQTGSNIIQQSDLFYWVAVLKHIREFIIKTSLQWMEVSAELVTMHSEIDLSVKDTCDASL